MPDLDQLTRGAVEIIGKKELEKKLKKGKKLRVKHGIDPTKPRFHLGYTVIFEVMRRFQEQGHKSVLLFGDFTGRIGDPTDKEDAREGLSKDKLQKNGQKLIRQAKKVLPEEGLEIRWNSEWWDRTNLKKFLNVAKHVSAARLWERDMFQKRLKNEKPVWTSELLYPILQGYDSVKLEADLTVIGSDQKFNELLAREVQKEHNQDPQALVIMPLLVGTDGTEKMSQSLENDIGIEEKPYSMYSKLMSMPDSNILPYFKLLTSVSADKLKEIENKLTDSKTNPKNLKQDLARKITTRFHSQKEAEKAEAKFQRVFEEKKPPQKMPEYETDKKEKPIKDLLVETELADSGSEAFRLIKQGGVKVDKETVKDPHKKIKIPPSGIILQRGKRRFVRVIPSS